MNLSSTEPPRFACRVVRWWSALTERSAPATSDEAASGHRAHCPACREYFQSVAALETRLRHQARANTLAAPAALEQRIAAAVRRARTPARAPVRRAFPRWSASLVAAAAAVVLVLVLNHRSLPSQTAHDTAAAEIAAVVATVDSLGQQFRETLAPSAARFAQAEPLRQELGCVQADARSALSFLAANFLPSERGAGLHDSPQLPRS